MSSYTLNLSVSDLTVCYFNSMKKAALCEVLRIATVYPRPRLMNIMEKGVEIDTIDCLAFSSLISKYNLTPIFLELVTLTTD